MTRFNLEKSIDAWRRRFADRRVFTVADLDELERHLRDHVDDLLRSGMDQQPAFREAIRRIGNAAGAEDDYRYVYWGKVKRDRGLANEIRYRTAMIRNYLLVAFRNMRRYPGYAVVNIGGLAAGLACVLLIGLFVRGELSYDRFWSNAERLYRVVSSEEYEEGVDRSARSPVPFAPQLQAELPEAKRVARFWRSFQASLGYGDRVFREPGLYFADPSALDMFSFDMRAGDRGSALSTPNGLVLTESAARRYFGDDDAMGRALTFTGYPGEDSLEFVVTGIMADLPSNTHLDFTALASLVAVDTEHENWGSWKPIWTYVELPSGADPAQLDQKLSAFADRHLNRGDAQIQLGMEPITQIHLDSPYAGGFEAGGSRSDVVLFTAIGLFILLLACVNFVNLSTARSMDRAREVGMRKAVGAGRAQLVGQFVGEAILVTFISVLLAIGLAWVALPPFNATFGTNLQLSLVGSAGLLWVAPALTLVVGIVASLYPALLLSGFRPVDALMGRRISAVADRRLRRGLVVFQFAVSTVLVIGTLVVGSQMRYLRTSDLGFDREQVVVLPYTAAERPFLDELKRNPSVVSASVTQRVPVNLVASDGRTVTPDGFQEPLHVDSYVIGDDFLETMGMRLLAGHALSTDRATDATAFLINETAVARFGWESPQKALGRTLAWQDETGEVVGVVSDFPVASMHEVPTPLVLQTRPDEAWWRTFVAVKIRPDDTRATLDFLERTWRRLTPGGAYEAFFLDDSFEALHRADARFGRIFAAFAGLAVLIACLGLVGLAAFTARRRTREIGVRKVLGATVPNLVGQLSKEFALLVMLGFVVATPVAWLVMDRWLSAFAYRVDLGPGVFVAAGVLTLIVALLSVASQAMRAAMTNPTRSLRHE